MNFEVAAAFKNHFSLILSYILWRLGVSSTQWRDIKRTWIKRTPKAESWGSDPEEDQYKVKQK